MGDTFEQAHLRDSFIKEELQKIKIEGINADEVYVSEIIKKAPKKGKILDIGTGTAHIPIKIAKLNRDLEIVATDLSEASAKIARENSSAFERIHILRADGHHLLLETVLLTKLS